MQTEQEPAGDTDSSVQAAVRSEQIRLLYQQLPIALGGSLIVILVIVAVLWNTLSPMTLVGWAAGFLLINLLRALSWRHYRKIPDEQRDYQKWRRINLLGTAASGLLTGSIGVVTAMSGHHLELSFLLIVFTGLCATALSTNGSSRSAMLAYAATLMLPTGLWLLIDGEPLSLALGGLILLFLITLFVAAGRYNRTLVDALKLRFRNKALYSEMAQANLKATESADSLREEMIQREEAERHLSAYAQRLQRANAALQREIAEREKNEQQLTQQALDILESEVRMRALFQNAFDAIITFAEDGLIDSCNPAAESLFGYSEKQLLGLNINELLPQRDEIFSTRQVVEQDGKRADGSLFPIAYSIDEMHIGPQLHYVCVVRDQTQAQQARQQLIRAKEAAESANTAKSEFLSNMSHELRTPLNAILGFTQLLQADPVEPLTEGQGESVEQISRAGWHLLQLINDVLDLAKIEAGRMETEAVEVPLEDLIQECVSLVQPNAEQKEIQLEDRTGGNQVVLLGDYVRLKQAFLNLLSNAIKYNREGGSVQILPPELRDDGRCRIGIQDSGFGLSEEQIEVIFSPFTRVAEDRAEIEGTGIGLTITQRLLNMMNGEIGVESEPGKGSLFWVELPLASGAETKPQSPEPQATEISTEPAKEPSGEYSILYVEDNPANLKLVQHIIKKNRPNYRLLSATNGEQGLEMALEQIPDLILLDISLPGMSGYDILQALQAGEDTGRIPTIALSANAMPNDIEKGLAAGFKAYLTKPIDVSKLLETLDGQLQGEA